MKARKDEILITVLFCGFLAVMMVCYCLLPKQDFSETEKRYLEEAPVFSWENLFSGSLGDDIETYLADHIPGRDFFVGLDAYVNLLSGRQVTKDVRLLSGDRIVEAPARWNETVVQNNLQAICGFADSLAQPVDFMIVPSAGWASESVCVTGLDLFSKDEYPDSQIISDLYHMAGENVRSVNVTSILEGREDYYYRTDHHWNSEGAYAVYSEYMDFLGREYPDVDAFRIETIPGFLGSTYSRSALWKIPSEDLALWHSGTELLVTNGETEGVHEGVFYPERLAEVDKYTVFLDGNHSMVRIENPKLQGAGKLLVIRDSYANSLGCFLAESYETVVLVDMRYYKKAVSELCAQEGFTDILICYSIRNFMTDTNLVWLR